MSLCGLSQGQSLGPPASCVGRAPMWLMARAPSRLPPPLLMLLHCFSGCGVSRTSSCGTWMPVLYIPPPGSTATAPTSSQTSLRSPRGAPNRRVNAGRCWRWRCCTRLGRTSHKKVQLKRKRPQRPQLKKQQQQQSGQRHWLLALTRGWGLSSTTAAQQVQQGQQSLKRSPATSGGLELKVDLGNAVRSRLDPAVLDLRLTWKQFMKTVGGGSDRVWDTQNRKLVKIADLFVGTMSAADPASATAHTSGEKNDQASSPPPGLKPHSVHVEFFLGRVSSAPKMSVRGFLAVCPPTRFQRLHNAKNYTPEVLRRKAERPIGPSAIAVLRSEADVEAFTANFTAMHNHDREMAI